MLITHTMHTNIVNESYQSLAISLELALKRLKTEADDIANQTMSDPIHLFDRLKFPLYHCGTGVYFIIHAPNASYNFETWKTEMGEDAKIMYVGQGNISQRKAIHTQIFRNGGNPRIFHNVEGKVTSQVDSVAARKMYRYDSNMRNWRFSYILTGKDWSPIIENYYIQKVNPAFNDEKMSGVA
jgi:hypothetical protein